jgi:two-component system phosphate regulon response regulator PhoB
MMPGSLNGLELCKRVKADPNHKKAKVVMLSARSQASDRQAGLDAYLSKPFIRASCSADHADGLREWR